MRKQSIVKTIRISFAALLLSAGVTANASTTWDFVSMANTVPGEKGFSILSLTGDGFSLDITGTKFGGAAFAYLDAGHGGLGVCGVLTSSLQCSPSSDDNITTGDVLTMTFHQAVTIDKIWFNNNHDGDGTLSGNKIKIGGTDYSLVLATGVPSFNDDWTPGVSFSVSAGGSLSFMLASTDADQFYVSGMTVTAAIPEPETYAMLLAGLGLLGFAARRRKQKEAA
jgi:hypothetical protein